MVRTDMNSNGCYYRYGDPELDLMMGSFSPVRRSECYGERCLSGLRGAGNRCLLVVDDEERIRDMYQRFFSRKGFEVLTASSAMEAKDLLVRRKVGILFLDINMAEVDGGTLYGLVRAFHPEVKVIVFSVYSIEEQRRRIQEADAYFDKSEGKAVLWDLVAHMVV